MKRLIFFVLILLFNFSCTRNPLKVDVSGIELEMKIRHFEQDLVAPVDSAKVNFLKEKYGEFFDIFTRRMIWIGGIENEDFIPGLNKFTSDTLIERLNYLVSEKIDQEKIESGLEKAFKHYKYYFPDKPLPTIVSCVSGFNQSIITADKLIGISLDKFLGSDCSYYSQLGLPEYKRKRMNPENILPEVMMAWGITEFPKNDNGTNLLSHIIYQGKLMYLIDAMLPDLNDSLKIGYTKKQLDFCEVSEEGMWAFLAEHKLLFSSQRMDVKRYINDGPYTNSFTAESPGRTGVWLGWQIIRAYMKKNPEITLAQLMQNQDYQQLLRKSSYHPE